MSHDGHRPQSPQASENDDSVDEFGRKKSTRTSRAPRGPRWPPAFDRRSATYAFDARSGMFYHSSTDFFYDPRTKYYYGNKQKAYFRHCPGENPPFLEVTQEKDEADQQQAKDNETKEVDKKTIQISLKTKLLVSSAGEKIQESDSNATSAEHQAGQQVSRQQKVAAVNMVRWNERGKENGSCEVTPADKVIKTLGGMPLCLLCKRKFVDVQALNVHEVKSARHLAKYEKRKAAMKRMLAYRDRASERRVLHGTDGSIFHVQRKVGEEPMETPASKPEDILDENNIGNQMLQKLGWTGETSLGRPGKEQLRSDIKEDWDRIEALASSRNHGARK